MSPCWVCDPVSPFYYRLRARELLEADSGGRGGGGGGGRGFDVSKAGDTRVGFVGFPSVGKSTLLTKLTGTHSEAAAYEASLFFTSSIFRFIGVCLDVFSSSYFLGFGTTAVFSFSVFCCTLILLIFLCLFF